MAESKRPEGSVWSIVGGPDGRRYIGYVWKLDDGSLELHDVFEFVVQVLQGRTSDGQVVPVKRCGLAPVAECLTPPTLVIRGNYTRINIQDLDEGDQKQFREMREEAEQAMTEARANRAGISLHAHPKGKSLVHS